MRNASNVVSGSSVTWTRVGLGAGGFCTDIDVADDGTWISANDTCGVYYRKPTDRQALECLRMGINVTESDILYGGGSINYASAIAASNSSVAAICQGGYVWVTANGWQTCTKTSLAYAGYPNGGGNRMCGNRRLAIDPASTTVIAFGDPNAGCRYTLNSGTAWTLIPVAQIPAPISVSGASAFMSIAFDRSSAVVSGKTQTVAVYSSGNGIYISTTGIDGTFSLIASSPTSLASMIYTRAGVLMTAGIANSGADGQFRTWTSGGGWLSPAGISGHSIASNTTTATTVYLFTEGGNRRASTDTGVTWTTVAGTVTQTTTDYPWIGWVGDSYLSNGNTIWDPNSGRILFALGLGIYEYVSPSTVQGAALPWNSVSRGIEQLCIQDMITTPTGQVIITAEDRAFFSFPQSKVDLSPGTYGPPNTLNSINFGGGQDYAIDNNAVIYGVSLTNGMGNYSTDTGKTWTTFATVPSNVSVANERGPGNIAVGNVGNAVWLPTGGVIPSYTLDGGGTWGTCNFGAAQSDFLASTSGLHNSRFYRRRCLLAVKGTPGTFILYVAGTGIGNAADLAMKGVWKSTDGGANWTRVYSSSIYISASYDIYNGKLKQPTGYPNDLLWTCGDIGNYTAPFNAGNFQISRDQGVTWNTITGITQLYDFAFGMAAPGASYPAIYAYGYVSGVRGLYRCFDFNPTTRAGTWVKFGDYPNGHFDTNVTLTADMTQFGVGILGFGSSGAYKFTFADVASAT